MRSLARKAVDAWLDATTARLPPDHADVTAQVEVLREAARERLRAEVRRTWDGAPGGLAAAVTAVALPAATDAMREAAVETVWRTRRRARINQIPISDNGRPQ